MLTNWFLGEDSFHAGRKSILDQATNDDCTCEKVNYIGSLKSTIHIVQNDAFVGWTLRELVMIFFSDYRLIPIGWVSGSVYNIGDQNQIHLIHEDLERAVKPGDSFIVVGRGADAERTAYVSKSESKVGFLRKSLTIDEKKIRKKSNNILISGTSDIHLDLISNPEDDVSTIAEEEELKGLVTDIAPDPTFGITVPPTEEQTHELENEVPAKVDRQLTSDGLPIEKLPSRETRVDSETSNTALVDDTVKCYLKVEKVQLDEAKLQTTGNKKSTLKGHIIVIGQAYLSFYRLVHVLRKVTLEKSNYFPILFLLPDVPVKGAWDDVARFPDVYWMLGKGYSVENLIQAGIESAYSVIVLTDPYNVRVGDTSGNQDEFRSLGDGLVDKSTLLTARVLYNLKSTLSLDVNIMTNFAKGINMSYLMAFKDNGVPTGAAVDAYACSCEPKTNCNLKSFKVKLNEFRSLFFPLTAQPYLEGEAWSLEAYPFFTMRFYVARLNMFRPIIDIFVDTAGTKGGITLQPISESFVGKTFEQIFIQLLLEGSVVLGLFRRYTCRDSDQFRGILFNPSPRLEILPSDHMYVLRKNIKTN